VCLKVEKQNEDNLRKMLEWDMWKYLKNMGKVDISTKRRSIQTFGVWELIEECVKVGIEKKIRDWGKYTERLV